MHARARVMCKKSTHFPCFSVYRIPESAVPGTAPHLTVNGCWASLQVGRVYCYITSCITSWWHLSNQECTACRESREECLLFTGHVVRGLSGYAIRHRVNWNNWKMYSIFLFSPLPVHKSTFPPKPLFCRAAPFTVSPDNCLIDKSLFYIWILITQFCCKL